MLATEVRAGDAPKPEFSMKTNQKSTNIRKSTQIPNWGRAGFIRLRVYGLPLSSNAPDLEAEQTKTNESNNPRFLIWGFEAPAGCKVSTLQSQE